MRMLAVKDAEALFDITDKSRSYLKQWLPWVDDMKSMEDSLSFIKNGFQIYAERKGLTAGVFFQGKLAGVAGYDRLDWINSTATIGYWLGVSFQGKGIMTRSVKALTDYAVQSFKLNRIEIRVAPENRRSLAIPERLGYIKEGHLRQVEWL